jgi:hypothetical protein
MTPLQQQRAESLGAQGFRVYTVDNKPLGKSIVDRESKR